MKLFLGTLVAVWLGLGTFAANGRNYFATSVDSSCTWAATTGLTIAAGPLNYDGVDPKESCRIPKLST